MTVYNEKTFKSCYVHFTKKYYYFMYSSIVKGTEETTAAFQKFQESLSVC